MDEKESEELRLALIPEYQPYPMEVYGCGCVTYPQDQALLVLACRGHAGSVAEIIQRDVT